MKEYNLIIVGGGAAGILCAIEANKKGMDNILLIEKNCIIILLICQILFQ